VKEHDAGWSSSVARWAHNPEVAGSNPAPATSFRRSGPFPGRERAFCVSGTVVKRVAATALRAARQRGGGDGVTRDETAWTWWTLPPAVSGCLAQRAHRISARGIRVPGAPGPCSSSWTARRAGTVVPMRLRIVPRALQGLIRFPRPPSYVTANICAREMIFGSASTPKTMTPTGRQCAVRGWTARPRWPGARGRRAAAATRRRTAPPGASAGARHPPPVFAASYDRPPGPRSRPDSAVCATREDRRSCQKQLC
jgi:hypothetical protein